MNLIKEESLLHFRKYVYDKKDVTSKFVVTSLKSNEDFTYKITGKNANGNYFISVYYEESYNSFIKCGFKGEWGVYPLNKFTRLNTITSNVVKGAIWFLSAILNEDVNKTKELLKKVVVQHTGTCIKCGRELTDEESINYGMGKTCRTK